MAAGKVEWTHRDTRVDILAMSKDSLFAKIRLTTMKNKAKKSIVTNIYLAIQNI